MVGNGLSLKNIPILKTKNIAHWRKLRASKRLHSSSFCLSPSTFPAPKYTFEKHPVTPCFVMGRESGSSSDASPLDLVSPPPFSFSHHPSEMEVEAFIQVLQFLLRQGNPRPIHVGVIFMTEQTVLCTDFIQACKRCPRSCPLPFPFTLTLLPSRQPPPSVRWRWPVRPGFSPRCEAASSVTSVSASSFPAETRGRAR